MYACVYPCKCVCMVAWMPSWLPLPLRTVSRAIMSLRHIPCLREANRVPMRGISATLPPKILCLTPHYDTCQPPVAPYSQHGIFSQQCSPHTCGTADLPLLLQNHSVEPVVLPAPHPHSSPLSAHCQVAIMKVPGDDHKGARWQTQRCQVASTEVPGVVP